VPLATPVERYSLLGHLDYEFDDNISGFVEASFGRAEGDVLSAQPRSFVPVPTALNNILTIARGNPFLPANLVAQMTALNLPTISVGRISNDIGPARGMSSNETLRVAAGLKGAFGGLNWDLYYQYGKNRHYQQLDNALIVANFRRAVDAVRNGSGQIVCRVNATTITDPACVPFNVIGENRFSPEALDYVTGSSIQRLTTDQHVAALNFSFEPVTLWAGPLSVAFGGEYRRESAFATVDTISQVGGFQTGNVSPIDGKIEVVEGYLELGVPLLRDSVIAKALDLNGAVRRTHYDTSGSVTTWKIGGTWDVVDGIRFRGTRSRDIRAPNMNELFTDPTFTANSIVDPRNSLQTLIQVTGGGNPALKPEVADTYTAGVVLTPSSIIPGLRLSVDYYDISIDGAIGNLGPQNIVNRCNSGLTEFCPLINNGAGLSGTITSVFNGFLNVNKLETAGLDIEVLYNLPLTDLSSKWDGDLTFRAIATHVTKMVTVDAGGRIDRAGQTGVPVGDVGGPSNPYSGGGGVPSWTVDGTIGYQKDPVGITLHGRYIAPGKFGAIFVGPDDPAYDPAAANSISDNKVAGRFYLDLAAQVDVEVGDGRKLQFFGSINNLLDKDPPVAPGTHITNPVLFDVVGRAYKVGVRFAL
jgi:outer membrane receptor protein involved in Fe transport